MMGKVVMPINETSNALELLQTINNYELTSLEKKILFMMTQYIKIDVLNDEDKKKQSLLYLEFAKEHGFVQSERFSNSELLTSKMEELRKALPTDIKVSAKSLIEKIETGQINLW